MVVVKLCSICGSREDNPYASQDVDLSETKMAKYAKDFYYITVCGRCYAAIEAFDAGDFNAFEDVHFCNDSIAKIFISKREIIRRHKAFCTAAEEIEYDARQRCYAYHHMDAACDDCSNRNLCLAEN